MADNLDESIEKATRFKEKHSLDSDEEDDEVKYDVLAEDDIEGQEEATIEFDDNIQITPFNMREELEEGHFDSDGTYIFDKSKDIKDNWIDNIDWVKVKHLNPEEAKKQQQYESDDEDSAEKKRADNIATYEEIMKILQEGETVAKAIRRLAKNKDKIPSASQKWRKKKQKTSDNKEEDQEAVNKAIEEQKEMLHLTELCDKLVQQGVIDIYETPYERIAFTLKQLKQKDQNSKLTVAESMQVDDGLDMFAEDFDSKEADKIKGTPGSTESKPDETGDSSKVEELGGESSKQEVEITEHTSIMWEYKIKNTDDSEIKGPFTTLQMISWAEDGTFNDGVFCRKYQSNGQFYNSSRMDFELYE
ncbi:unnamed protein product [Candidula unifasciata]|uniref:GYF domain-containing protein n=1 Tax=Candidula unifasciata TaxID=100452 RepID=A0A8S3YUY3_9EUPU|nr:unnamed protein product [Candidula unifasciata]